MFPLSQRDMRERLQICCFKISSNKYFTNEIVFKMKRVMKDRVVGIKVDRCKRDREKVNEKK